MKIITKNLIKFISTTIILSSLIGCSNQDGPPLFPIDVSHVKEPVPKAAAKSKYGNPKKYVVFGKEYKTLDSSKNFSQTGVASWYGTKFHGRRTSSGELYDMYALTGAHKSLPLPTYAKVTNLDNNKSLIIKINDRGPFHDDRIVDLSYAAAAKLGVLGKGTANVELTAINLDSDINNDSFINYAHRTPTESKIKPKAEPKHYSSQELVQLQLGAFKDRYNAERLIKTASKIIDLPLMITRNTTNNKNNIFKVQTNKFNIEQLQNIKSQLEQINIKNPVMVKTS